MPDFNRRIGRRLLLGGGAAVLAPPLPAHTQGAGPAPAGDGVGQGNQQPEITVDRARTAPIPIAVPNFTGQLGTGITGVISNNLARSGLFRPIEQAAQVGQGLGQGDGGDAPNFAAWKATGAQALAAAGSSRPDVVLLDLGLPDMDGVEVIAGLRGWTQVPIIVLSARQDSGDKVQALDAGADDYVTKPFAMDELLARLRALGVGVVDPHTWVLDPDPERAEVARHLDPSGLLNPGKLPARSPVGAD